MTADKITRGIIDRIEKVYPAPGAEDTTVRHSIILTTGYRYLTDERTVWAGASAAEGRLVAIHQDRHLRVRMVQSQVVAAR